MPFPYSAQLFISITHCESYTFTKKGVLESPQEGNCIFQLLSGKCNLIYKDKTTPLPARTVLLLARNIACTLECETTCQGILLHFTHSRTPISFDLNHLCLQASSVDTFFGYKKKLCLLSDQESIHITLSSILYEWEHRQPERDMMLRLLLNELIIRLARSYFAHRKPNGIQFLAQAREYILQNYQRPLTIDDIADAVGISRSYLSMLFSRHMSRTIVEYIQAVRCDHAAFLLSTTHFSIIDIAVEVGFNNRQHFARTFGKFYGMSPNSFRQAHSLEKT